MLTFNQFKNTRKLKDIHSGEMYAYHGGFFANIDYDQLGEEIYIVLGEVFTSLESAELTLYQMYCDEDRLSEGY